MSSEIQSERTDIDVYKMVTFTLGGKDYGIDIMKIKEILKVNKFTFVPNSEPYVRGVYNLRGDIISIIDLRIMFRVNNTGMTDKLEDIIVLNIDDKRIGVIVDNINKVIGVAAEEIQPPHPIFSGINVKYIRGVVNKDSKIYIILDVDRILGLDDEKAETILSANESAPAAAEQVKNPEYDKESAAGNETDLTKDFIKDTLKTFINFHVTDINSKWYDDRYAEWIVKRRSENENVQLSGREDAEIFIGSFYSKNTGAFIDDAEAEKLRKILPSGTMGNLYVWNIGCANGFETYSLTALLKELNPDAAIKVWANDKDLLSISNAPNIIINKNKVPQYLKDFVSSGIKGDSFSQDLKDLIYFEFHDVKNHNPYPDADIIICRDVMSFFDYNDQLKVISDIYDKLKDNGLLITGDNEIIYLHGLEHYEEHGLHYYKKNTIAN